MIAPCRSMVLTSRDTPINRQWKSSDTQARQSTSSWSGGVSGQKRSPLPCPPLSPSYPLPPPSPPQPPSWQSSSWRGRRLRRLLKVGQMRRERNLMRTEKNTCLVTHHPVEESVIWCVSVAQTAASMMQWRYHKICVNPNENSSHFHQYSKKNTDTELSPVAYKKHALQLYLVLF